VIFYLAHSKSILAPITMDNLCSTFGKSTIQFCGLTPFPKMWKERLQAIWLICRERNARHFKHKQATMMDIVDKVKICS